MNRKIVLNLASKHHKSHRDASQALRMNLAVGEIQLQDLTRLFRKVLADENFLTLLRAEGLVSVPSCLIRRMG